MRLSIANLILAGMFAAFAMPVQAQEPAPDLVAAGDALFATNCKSCHGVAGGGFVGPKLVGNDRLANADFVIRQITKGSADMPPFGKRLTPDEILAVGTFVRNVWGNAYGALPN